MRAGADPQAAGRQWQDVGFRQVMSQHAAGVSVVTTRSGDRPVGLTVTSLASCSELPPSVSFNVGLSARSYPALVNATAIGVHLLAADQWPVAEVFSSRAEDKFAAVDWRWDGGVPRLPDTMAFLLCTPAGVFAHGDHSILVAEIRRAEMRQESPLVYLRRSASWRLAEVAQPR